MATNDFSDIKVYWDITVTGNVEVWNADTTISRSSAGVIAVEWEIIPSLTRAATFSTGIKTFLAGMFALRNVANTFSAFFTNTNTADRTYTLPDKNGTVAMTSDITGTNSWTNTGDQTSIVGITGTLAQFNTAMTDADFATGWGTATGSNTGDNATNTQYSGLAASKEDTANKSTSITTDQASNTKFPSVKSVYDWATGLFATISNLALKAPIANPTFTGTVWGITAAMVWAPSGSGTSSGTNTWDQTSIVWLTGTKAQFNAAVTDGDFNFSPPLWYSAISATWAITVWNIYWVNCTTWNIVLTLSSWVTVGDTLTVKKVDNSSNTITINSVWIDWSTSVTIDTQDESLDLFWNGTSFIII
jgi:hypothetical protein